MSDIFNAAISWNEHILINRKNVMLDMTCKKCNINITDTADPI